MDPREAFLNGLAALFDELIPDRNRTATLEGVCIGLAKEAVALADKYYGGPPLTDGAVGPHSCDPENCPTFYDYCHCTVESLVHNINHAEALEAQLETETQNRNLKLGGNYGCINNRSKANS